MSHPWHIFPSGKKCANMANSFQNFWKGSHKHMHLEQDHRSHNSVRNWAKKYRDSKIQSGCTNQVIPFYCKCYVGIHFLNKKTWTHNLQSTLTTCITLLCQCSTFHPSFFLDIPIPLERKPLYFSPNNSFWTWSLRGDDRSSDRLQTEQPQ